MGGPAAIGPALPLGPPDAGARFGGVVRLDDVPQPQAGTAPVFTVPGGTLGRPLLVTGRLTTSAVVAVRLPTLTVRDPDARNLFAMPSAGGQAAGLVVDWFWAAGLAIGERASAPFVCNPMPAFWLPAGYQVRIPTTLIDAGDQWSNVRILWEELDQGPLGEQFGTDATATG